MRLALGIEYDGCRYHGWQTQTTGPTVQAALETALSRVADEPVRVTCAGRTDAGVHATGQVVHFDTGARRRTREWALGTNAGLPDDIAVQWVQPVAHDFHARFDARERSYTYLILNRPLRSALLRDRCFWVHRPLDADAMAEAAAPLQGRHDFSAFRAAECQARSPVRTVTRISLRRIGDFVALEISANAFLHHMVRNIAGSLVAVGKGRRPAAWLAEVLDGQDRRRAGMTAPAAGLYLVRVDYGDRLATPAAADPLSPATAGTSAYDDWWAVNKGNRGP